MTRALKGQIISGNGKAVAQRNAVVFLALKGQVKNMLKSNLPLQGTRFYYRYVVTGALPPD